ncbi:MAG: hypothetical protein AAGC77_10215 [Pseudomonadota bacterium]
MVGAMRFIRFLSLAAGIIAVLTSALLLAAIASATGWDFPWVGQEAGSYEVIRLLAGATALSFFIFLVLASPTANNTLSGAALVLSAVIAVTAFAPEIAPKNLSDEETRSAGPELQNIVERAADIDEMYNRLPFSGQFESYEGTASALFTVRDAAQRLRFSLSGLDDEWADTVLRIHEIEANGAVGEIVATDDDSGANLSSMIEIVLEPGRYLLVMSDLFFASGKPSMTFELRIESASLDEIASERREVTLSRDETARYQFPDDSAPSQTPGTRYLLKVEAGDAPVCLVVDVDPVGGDAPGEMDPILFFMNTDFRRIDYNDDIVDVSDGRDYGARISWLVPPSNSVTTYIAEVRGYGPSTTFNILVDIELPDNEGRCEASSYSRND